MDTKQRAARVRTFLEDPVIAEAFQAIERRHLDTIVNSQPAEVDRRENAYRSIHAISQLKQELQSVITDATFEERQIKRKS